MKAGWCEKRFFQDDLQERQWDLFGEAKALGNRDALEKAIGIRGGMVKMMAMTAGGEAGNFKPYPYQVELMKKLESMVNSNVS